MCFSTDSKSAILDSGNRRQFDSGAVRDIDDNKGRCDLMPLGVVAELFSDPVKTILHNIDAFMHDPIHNGGYIYAAIHEFCGYSNYTSVASMLLDVSMHYKDGCSKYGERNWEKGIPAHCYVDSGVRHLLKYVDGRNDERHDRAFIWNMLGLLWTCSYHVELWDIEFPSGDSPTAKEIE